MGRGVCQGTGFDPWRGSDPVSLKHRPRHVTDVATRITNYKAYLSYISALTVLLARENGQKYLQTALETLSGLAKRFGGQERAPLLARLEINRRLCEAQFDVEAPSGENGDDSLLKAYWADFGHKGSVLDDLGTYVTAQSDFTATLREAVGIEAVGTQLLRMTCADSPDRPTTRSISGSSMRISFYNSYRLKERMPKEAGILRRSSSGCTFRAHSLVRLSAGF